MTRVAPLAATVAMMLNPLAALACDPSGPPSLEQGASVSVGRIADLIWSATVVAGRQVSALEEDVWLQVEPDGTLAGRAGCNRFSGRADLDAGVFSVAELAMTEIACAPDVMEREAAFLKALSETEAFRVSPTGPLYLLRLDGTVTMCLG
jgi:heat shock protein HslJ